MRLQTSHIVVSNCSRKEHSLSCSRECKKVLPPQDKTIGKETEDEVIHNFPEREALEKFPDDKETKLVPLPELDLEEDEIFLSYKPNKKEKVSDLPKRITRSETKKASSKVYFCVRK
jgi:hypothetical protein